MHWVLSQSLFSKQHLGAIPKAKQKQQMKDEFCLKAQCKCSRDMLSLV